MPDNRRKKVVVTGLGVVSPIGSRLPDFEKALKEGASGIRFCPELSENGFACQIAGIVPDFNAVGGEILGGEALGSLPASIAYGSTAALLAWKDAGLSEPDPDGEPDWDTGAVIGTGIGDMDTIANKIVPLVNAGQVRRMGSRIIEHVMHSGATAQVAGLLGLGNRTSSNASACSTGTEAVIEAARHIRCGAAKRMLAGGAEGSSPYTWAGFDSMMVLCRKFNSSPKEGSRPMSASACGFVPGAGAGILVLEDYETAVRRGARIYAEVAGGSLNSGGQRNGGTMTAPNREGVKRCIKGALLDSGILTEELNAISGHLTATFADPLEIQNWAAALRRGPENFPFINAPKSLFGHCLGAAGAIECVAAVLELYGGFLHTSLNCEDLHPEIEPFANSVVRNFIEKPDLKNLAKASFGFGDVNACVVFKKT
ncbi:MAG: beta-ketoacyl-[acyl-carrier-protein] synthase family protein [Deltaproteobacteria bacterium]|nr:beta-ketoacyl-[acyl-carrier-protein] synthase family protein [Deltaproteobacteria bacterium]